MHRSLIALGANIEASSNLFHAALGRLASAPDVILDRCSQVIPTAPIGADAGAEFLNAAATIQTSLPPHELLQRLHEVENEFGRKRTIHWGPRRLDLDLILYESEVVCDDQLVVPHPACWYRRFVLQPAAEVAGDMIHPLLNESIEQLYSRLCRRPILIQIEAGSSGLDAGGIAEKLKSAVPLVGFESKDDVLPKAGRNVFVVARLEAAVEKKVRHGQPRGQSGRRLIIRPLNEADAITELTQLARAILGE